MKRTFSLHGTPHLPLVVLEAAAADAPPSRIKLLNWGKNESTKGDFIVGEVTVATLSANQRRFNFDTICLDFNHNTVPGTPAYKEAKEPRPVAAKGRAEVVPGEGLFITDLSWTPEGLANWKNYQDVSATPARDEAGNVIFLHSAAICRQGAVPGMELVAASVDLAELPPVVALSDETMAAVVEAVGYKLRDAEWYKREAQETRAALDKANQTNAALQAALEALTAQVTALKAQLEAAQSAAAPVTALTALTADVGTLRTAQAAAADKHERDLLLLTARMQGKIIALSADKLATVALDTLRDLVATAKPGQVPLGRLTPLAVDPGSLDGRSAAEEAAAARIMRKAKQISAANPTWQWSRCWSEAQD